MLFEKAESIDYRYDVNDRTVEGLLILPLYGSMPTGILSLFVCVYVHVAVNNVSFLYIHRGALI